MKCESCGTELPEPDTRDNLQKAHADLEGAGIDPATVTLAKRAPDGENEVFHFQNGTRVFRVRAGPNIGGVESPACYECGKPLTLADLGEQGKAVWESGRLLKVKCRECKGA